MYPSTILFALATAVGLINAVAIPQPGTPEYDTCIDQYGQVFGGDLNPGAAECTGCAAQAVGFAFVVYGGNSDNLELAKDEYNANMAQCRGPNDDQTYNTCIEDFAVFVGGDVTPGPAECSACAAQALAAGIAYYRANPNNVDEAKRIYTAQMEACPRGIPQ